MPQRPRACADWLRMSCLGARGSAVAAGSTLALRGCIWVHVSMCGTGACHAPAAADALWCRVERACSARAEDAVVTGLARRGVREHRRYARELLRERFAMYLYTIESVPFMGILGGFSLW